MKLIGLSDSLAGIARAPETCAACGSEAQVNGGACLSCLLRSALEPAEDIAADEESFAEVLAEVSLPDRDWRLGNYQILEEIGRGGMGVIYRARQRHSKRIVALKRVLGYHGDSRETLERFRREAEAAASLDHPNILPIYEVGESEGLPFFTMKFATGGSLQQAGPALSAEPHECVHLVAKVARAVAHAHREGILHRDLKPGNILLDGRGEPFVTDFGLAKWMDTSSDLTRSLAVFGTPGFIAPEQAEGPRAQVGPPADIYSLGAVLFDLLTGRPPFLGEHALTVIRQAAENPAPKLRSIRRTIDRDLETICAKCLEREPVARYRTATDLADDLERWLEGRPIVARPVSAPARVWRWSRRNPVLAGAVVLCLLISAVAMTRQLDGRRLQKEISAQLAAQHSVEVLPLLDLDTVQPSRMFSSELAANLERDLNAFGPAKVRIASAQNLGPTASALAQPSLTPARTLLSGTTRLVNGKRRVSLHLLETNSGAPLLHEMIETEAAFAASTAARALAGRAYALLSAPDLKAAAQRSLDPGLLDPVAKSFIDQGVELMGRRGGLDLDRSIGCLKHATELQPNSAAAYATLAKALGYKASYQSSREPLTAGLEYARKAVALDHSSADAHLGLAALLHHYGKINESIQETLLALEYSPTSRRAAFLLLSTCKATGRPDKALMWADVALKAGRPAAPEAGVGDCLSLLGADQQAEAIYEQYHKLHPEQPDGWMGICRLRLLHGRIDEARAIYERETKGYADFTYASQMAAQVEFFGRNFSQAEKLYAQLHEQDAGGGGAFFGAISYTSALGRLRLESDPEAGRDLLERARAVEAQVAEEGREHPAPWYRLAAIEASLGDRTAALSHLQAAADAGWIDYRSLEMDPRFDGIRLQPPFQAILAALKARVESMRNNLSGAVGEG